MFTYREPENPQAFSLHDCIAEGATYHSGVLTFFFPNGFWVTPAHPANTTGQTSRTTAA